MGMKEDNDNDDVEEIDGVGISELLTSKTLSIGKSSELQPRHDHTSDSSDFKSFWKSDLFKRLHLRCTQ